MQIESYFTCRQILYCFGHRSNKCSFVISHSTEVVKKRSSVGEDRTTSEIQPYSFLPQTKIVVEQKFSISKPNMVNNIWDAKLCVFSAFDLRFSRQCFLLGDSRLLVCRTARTIFVYYKTIRVLVFFHDIIRHSQKGPSQ